jgi:transposase
VAAETLLPGATLNEVARRHSLPTNHVSSWQTLARKGRLVLPAPEDPVKFAVLIVGPVSILAHHDGTFRGRQAIAGWLLVIRHVMFQAALVEAHQNTSSTKTKPLK